MKNGRYLLLVILGQIAFMVGAGADPSDNPYTQVDADGVPLSVTRAQPKQLSPDQVAAIRKEQQKQARDKDWLVRDYEEQLRNRATADKSGDRSVNLYYQLSSNKELAKLAGIPLLDGADEDGKAVVPHTNDAAALRTDSSATAASRVLFKPLITPLSSPDAAGLHDFYSTLLPSSAAPASSTDPSAATPAPTVVDNTDPADIETPGMIAAEKDPLAQADPVAQTDSADLSLDMLPGETVAEAKKHQENENKLELALPMDATQLHKAQAVTLSAPTPANAIQPTPVTTPTKPAPIVDQNAPIPVSHEHQITPIRGPIASPFDILNR